MNSKAVGFALPRSGHQDIRDCISSGEYSPGGKLSSLRELIDHYGVSAEPVRSAILILQAEGLLEGRQGKGVYVTKSGD